MAALADSSERWHIELRCLILVDGCLEDHRKSCGMNSHLVSEFIDISSRPVVLLGSKFCILVIFCMTLISGAVGLVRLPCLGCRMYNRW